MSKGARYMLVTSKELFKIAQENRFAIPAVNFTDQYMLRTYISVAEKLNKPIIVSFAQAHHENMELEEAAMLGNYYANRASVPVVLHLDHGEDLSFIKRSIDLGFSSVMIDASLDELTENIKKTKEIVNYAHLKKVVVEAEIGHVGSGNNYENMEVRDSQYTSVLQAEKFYRETKVDSLAISIGTAHGDYKGKPKINFERLKEINNKLETPLVLHGGSSTGDFNLSACTNYGIVKINIFTDIINNSVQNLEKSDNNYFEIQQQMCDGMAHCVSHYFKIFKTQTVTL